MTFDMTEHLLPLEIRTLLEFNRKFKFPVSQDPTHLTAEHAAERHTYMAEELEEFRQAAIAQDMVKMLDALLDLDYFLRGTIVRMGLQHVWPLAHLEVHLANMKKEVGLGHRGFVTDLVKPAGWTSPDGRLSDLLELAGYDVTHWHDPETGTFNEPDALSAAIVEDQP